jgi:uncharacterized membrane protein YdjX (TVP38/TMEM64 family)
MTNDTTGEKTNKWKFLILVAVVAAAVFVSVKYDIRSFSPEAIRDRIIAFGVVAPVVFITLYALRPIVLFPASIFSLAGGLAFGTWRGGMYNYIGAILSAILAFVIARYMGREYVQKIMKGKLQKFEELMDREGFTIVFYLRFFAPFDPLSYAAGLSKISFRDHLIATMIPIIPATFAFSNFGNSFSKIKSVRDLMSTEFLLPLAILLAAMMIPLVVKKIAKKREIAK